MRQPFGLPRLCRGPPALLCPSRSSFLSFSLCVSRSVCHGCAVVFPSFRLCPLFFSSVFLCLSAVSLRPFASYVAPFCSAAYKPPQYKKRGGQSLAAPPLDDERIAFLCRRLRDLSLVDGIRLARVLQRTLVRKRLGITVFQPRLKVCTFARTNYYEYGKQRQVQESP